MDRHRANTPQSQFNFVEFLALPMFTKWEDFLKLPKEVFPCVSQVLQNKAYWKAQIDEMASKKITFTVTPRTDNFD